MTCDRSTPAPKRRIIVIGVTGSGKTTLARRLARHFGIPHVELDALHWEPNWTEAPTAIFRERTARAVSGDRWVVDGNYGKVRDIVWGRADTVVWLDFPLPVILRQLARRTFQRAWRQEELWSGNRERLYVHFFTRESLFWWALKTYRRRRREYPLALKQPEYAHLAVVHLRSPRAVEAWFAGLPAPAGTGGYPAGAPIAGSARRGRAPSSRSSMSSATLSSPIILRVSTIWVAVFSSSTCSVTNHCKNAWVG